MTIVFTLVVAVIAAMFAISYFDSATSGVPSSRDAVRSDLAVPVVRESFTLLPCSTSTTLGLEGCAERKILSLDLKIDALRDEIFGRLYNRAAKHRFIIAESDWFTYRQALCSSESDRNEGGSLVGVDFADCAARLDQRHVAELKLLHSSYVNN